MPTMDDTSYTGQRRDRRGARRLGMVALAALAAVPAAAVATSALISRRHGEAELDTGKDVTR